MKTAGRSIHAHTYLCYSLSFLMLLLVPAAPLSQASERTTPSLLHSASANVASSRRLFAVRAPAMAAALMLNPLPARGLQEKNEALCNTGFFTNIWQYKCTDIGDIEDEGVATGLSTTEQTATDSLLGKLIDKSDTKDVGKIRIGDEPLGESADMDTISDVH